MKRFIALCGFVFLGTIAAHAQGFPESEKQPRPAEMKKNQKHYKHMAHRHHVSRRLNHEVAAPRKRT